MLLITLILLLITGYFARREYINGRPAWAMYWSVLVGWDLHSLLSFL